MDQALVTPRRSEQEDPTEHGNSDSKQFSSSQADTGNKAGPGPQMMTEGLQKLGA